MISDELSAAALRLERFQQEAERSEVTGPLSRLEDAVNGAGRAWSGSSLGYHARVYYMELQPPPPGAHFSPEWGFSHPFGSGSASNWVEFPEDFVKTAIEERAGHPDLGPARALATSATEVFAAEQAELLSLLTITQKDQNDDFIARVRQDVEEARIRRARDVLKAWQPKGQFSTRDSLAASQGFWVPPHFRLLAQVEELRAAPRACQRLGELARRGAAHLARRDRTVMQGVVAGNRIFIGHGSSPVWMELRTFLQDRLGLPWEEFNRVPVAGIPNSARLAEMLDSSAMAFLVLTAEDVHPDGTMHARENVVHEAGLFQGRFGFSKAIVLLEEGCTEFSNIEGLGQIRFPKGKISAVFEDVRRVLEREELLKS